MKRKTLILLSTIFLLFIVSGCDSSINRRNIRTEINELILQYPSYSDELEVLKKELEQNPGDVYRIVDKLENLKLIMAGVYDGYIRIKIVDLTAETIFDQDVLYHNGDSLFDIISTNFTHDYQADKFISIAGTFIDLNYHLTFYYNNTLTQDLTIKPFSNDDTLLIRNQPSNNLSLVDLQVDRTIYKFIRHHANRYFTKEPVLDQYVVSGIRLMEEYLYDVSLSTLSQRLKVEEYFQKKVYDITNPVYAKTLIKDTITMIAYGQDAHTINKMLTRIQGLPESYGMIQNNNILLALSLLGDDLARASELLEHLTDYQVESDSTDVASSALLALANYHGFEDYQINLIKFRNFLKSRMTKNGIDHFGPNCLATSAAIIALLANGISPTSKEWEVEGINLIQALLQYEQEGNFSWSTDGEIDTVFSTPQAFAALVTYKISRDYKTNTIKLFKGIE